MDSLPFHFLGLSRYPTVVYNLEGFKNMATATINAIGDVTIDFDSTFPASPTTHYTKVDEGTTTPDDADYNETTTTGDIDRYSLGTTPPDLSQLTQVSVNLRGYLTDVSATAKFEVELYHSGNPGTKIGATITKTGADLGGYGTTPTTDTCVWAGLTLNKTQADSLQLQIKFLDA